MLRALCACAVRVLVCVRAPCVHAHTRDCASVCMCIYMYDMHVYLRVCVHLHMCTCACACAYVQAMCIGFCVQVNGAVSSFTPATVGADGVPLAMVKPGPHLLGIGSMPLVGVGRSDGWPHACAGSTAPTPTSLVGSNGALGASRPWLCGADVIPIPQM